MALWVDVNHLGIVIKVTASSKLIFTEIVANKDLLCNKKSKSVIWFKVPYSIETVPIPLSSQVFENLLLHKIRANIGEMLI